MDVFHIFAQEASGEDGASPTLTRFEVAHPFAPGLQAARPIENIESRFSERNGANQNTRRCELWEIFDVRGGVILLIEMNVKQTVFINLSAEEIFAYMSDLENLVDWCSAIVEVRKNSPGAIHVGTMVRSTIRFLGRWANLAFEVVEYDPCRSMTIKGISGAAPCLFCYQFEPGEEGGTTVCQEAVIHLAEGILAQEKPVITSAIRRQLGYDLMTLKDVLEASAATEGSAGEWRRTLS